jgi:hypothetical protein
MVKRRSKAAQALRRIRDRLRGFFPGVAVFGKALALMYSPRSFLRQSGYVCSVATRRPCRPDGTPIPWMNYGVVAFLEQRLRPDHVLFEYGSGNSTLYFAARVKEVVAVESDRAWFDELSRRVPPNVHLSLVEAGDTEAYRRAIGAQGRCFDIVLVDGEDRSGCAIEAQHHLSPRGVIIVDDSQREATHAGIEALCRAGLRRLDFDGLKPGSISGYRTTILYRDSNCLGI